MGPARYEISRSDDEGDCGRGRSEAKPNGVPPMAAPCERNTKKEGDCQSFDFLVTPFFILEGIPSSHLEITMHLADTSFDNHIGSKTPHLLKIGGDSRKTI